MSMPAVRVYRIITVSFPLSYPDSVLLVIPVPYSTTSFASIWLSSRSHQHSGSEAGKAGGRRQVIRESPWLTDPESKAAGRI